MFIHLLHLTISERFALGAAQAAVEVTEEAQSAGGGELSPASSAGCGGHRAHGSRATPPSCLQWQEGRAQVWTGTQELRDMGLGGLGWPQAQAAGLGTAAT